MTEDDGYFPPIPHVIAAGSGDDAPARVVYEPPVETIIAGSTPGCCADCTCGDSCHW